MARNGKDDVRSKRRDRAQQTRRRLLEQLDWCVDYLYRIRKDRIARAIQKSRTQIRQRMTDGRNYGD
jgi:hypothetical protein